MPKRLAVLILVTFIPMVSTIYNFFKNYNWNNFKSDLGSITFGILWLIVFIRLITGLFMYLG